MTDDSISLHVLLVEDDDVEATLLQRRIRAIEPSVAFHRADRLSTATRALDDQRFDAVLLDLDLPDSIGPNTVTNLCTAARRPPIVVLTNDGGVGDATMQRGAADYLVKGANPRDILRAVSFAIERRRSREAAIHVERVEGAAALARGLAHDLGNLFQVIGGNAALLRVEGVNPSQAELLSDILAAVEQGKGISDDLLTLSRRKLRSLTPIDVRPVILRLVRLVRRTMPAMAIDVTISNAGSPAVPIDPALLEQALLNLLLNAHDATGGRGRVTISTESQRMEEGTATPGDWFVVSVADSGPGIAPDHIDAIFDASFSTKSTGRGLGLPMAQQVAEHHGGFITVASPPGQGCRFELWFLRPTDPEIVEGHVLVVDDEAPILRFVHRALKDLGHEVHTFDDGVHVLAHCAEHPVALALLDLHMPGVLGGIDLATELRTRFPRVRIVFHSGFTHDERVTALGLDTTTFLPKPYTPDQLMAFLKQALARPA